jgi:hypothetical protein
LPRLAEGFDPKLAYSRLFALSSALRADSIPVSTPFASPFISLPRPSNIKSLADLNLIPSSATSKVLSTELIPLTTANTLSTAFAPLVISDAVSKPYLLLIHQE